jgi:hypothetical protein
MYAVPFRPMTEAQRSRVARSVRMTPGGIRAVDEIANRYGCSWSEAVRRMLAIAYPDMPAKWPGEL